MLRRSGVCAAAAAVLACLAVSARAAPTQDTLVVRADDVSTPSATPQDPATEASVSTSAPPPPLKMSTMEVRAEVALRYAHTSVVTRVRNPAAVAQEATFSLLLPDTAFISGFVMTLDGKDYKAYVKEKAEAKQEYDAAVAHGHAAAHVSVKARDSNHFTVRVNVEPQSEARFNLTYEELLQRRNSLYNLAINLHPGGVVPKLSVVVHLREGRRITQLRVPALRTGNEIDPTDEDPQNPGATVVWSADKREATVTFVPDLAEQRRLIDIYTQKTRESRARSSNPRHVAEELEGEMAGADGEGVLGQFVVQYDVEHSADGEIFLNDGYFVHFYSPPQLAPLNKHVVFVLDTSGSMMDRKIAQLREAMASILKELRPGDYFNIVEFASDTHVYELEEAKREITRRNDFYWGMESQERNVTLVPPTAATPENIALAQTIVSRLNAAGGTNINEALVTALRLVRRGVHWNKTLSTDSNVGTTVTPVVFNDATTAATVTQAKGGAEPEPIIIFLTDGDATVGELDPKRIHKKITELNTGSKRAAIFSLAFGEDADRSFLRKLSLRNEGFMRHIYEAADAAAQLRSFYRQVSSPLLADVKFVYPPEQVEEGSVTKQRFHTLYAGGETVVAGRVASLTAGAADPAAPAYFTPTVEGFCGVQDNADQKEYRVTPRVPLVRDESSWGALERLWAYITIKQKLDERDAAADVAPAAPAAADISPEKQALQLALKYSFVTPLTSLVVVKPNASSAVDAESVDKKQPFPATLLVNKHALMSAGTPGAAGGLPHTYAGLAGGPPGYAYASSAFIAPAPQSLQGAGLMNALSESFPIALQEDYEDAYQIGASQPDSAAPSVDLGLHELAWAMSLVNASARVLTLQFESGARDYKLAATDDLPAQSATAAPGAACATRGGAGVCVYLTRCSSAKNISLLEYTSSLHCDLRGYAGVCCSEGDLLLQDGTLTSTSTQAAPAA